MAYLHKVSVILQVIRIGSVSLGPSPSFKDGMEARMSSKIMFNVRFTTIIIVLTISKPHINMSSCNSGTAKHANVHKLLPTVTSSLFVQWIVQYLQALAQKHLLVLFIDLGSVCTGQTASVAEHEAK